MDQVVGKFHKAIRYVEFIFEGFGLSVAAVSAATTVSHGPAGVATITISMHIPSPIMSAAKKENIRSSHVNPTAVHITDTSRKCRQYPTTQKQGGSASNGFGL
jgi:hypothetical protein